jgi:hypothetical protein
MAYIAAIISRTREGRARFVANGGKLGRKPTLTAYQIGEARIRRANAEAAARASIFMLAQHEKLFAGDALYILPNDGT